MSIKKILIGSAAALIFGGAAVFIVIPALSQSSVLPPGEYDLEAGQYVFNVPDLAATPTEIPVTPTDTPVPPTDTPVPPPTVTPTDVPGAHNDTEWHPVSADVSHTHNADPDSMAHIFGPTLDYLPQSIGYAWNAHGESEDRHEGYKWGVAEYNECVQRLSRVGENCVLAWRIQYHWIGGPDGQAHRFHSGYGELLICTPDQQDCGILRIGLPLIDYGCLRSNRPIHREYIPLPTDGDCHDGQPDGFYYRRPYRETNDADLLPTNSGIVPSGWNAQDGIQNSVEWAIKSFDDWQGIVRDDPAAFDFVCPDFQCEYNHSTAGFYRVVVDGDWLSQFIVNGFANFNGTIDAEGNPNSGCTLGPDCAPLVLENVPAGEASYTVSAAETPTEEFDLSPPGEWWIEYPN